MSSNSNTSASSNSNVQAYAQIYQPASPGETHLVVPMLAGDRIPLETQKALILVGGNAVQLHPPTHANLQAGDHYRLDVEVASRLINAIICNVNNGCHPYFGIATTTQISILPTLLDESKNLPLDLTNPPTLQVITGQSQTRLAHAPGNGQRYTADTNPSLESTGPDPSGGESAQASGQGAGDTLQSQINNSSSPTAYSTSTTPYSCPTAA